MPAESLEAFSPLVEPAVVELWHMHGIGCTADGFLKVIDPGSYLAMIGEYLPRPDMIPVLATGMGDIVVAYSGKYRVLQFRYARVTGGVGSSLARIGRRAADREYLEEFLDAKPYFEAARTYGRSILPMTSTGSSGTNSPSPLADRRASITSSDLESSNTSP